MLTTENVTVTQDIKGNPRTRKKITSQSHTECYTRSKTLPQENVTGLVSSKSETSNWYTTPEDITASSKGIPPTNS